MGEEFNIDYFMQNYNANTENRFANTILTDDLSAIIEIINISVFIINLTVIAIMFFRCRKFRQTKVYDDFAGTNKLAKAVEIIMIFLAIDAVYSLTRIFALIDAINLIKQIFPDLPASVFIYPIAVGVVLPILSFALSICVWNMYHNTKKMFYSLYPNGALTVISDNEPKRAGEGLYGADTNPGSKPVFKSKIPTISDSFDAYKNAAENTKSVSGGKEEDIFGTGASIEYLTSVNKNDEAKMDELLIQDAPIESADNEYINAPSDDDNGIFGTGNSTDWQPVGDMDSSSLADMLAGEEEEQDGGFDFGNDNGDLFGAGTSADYMKTDEAKFAELLVQDEQTDNQ